MGQVEGHFILSLLDPQSHGENCATIRDQGGCRMARISPIGQREKLRLGTGKHCSKGQSWKAQSFQRVSKVCLFLSD